MVSVNVDQGYGQLSNVVRFTAAALLDAALTVLRHEDIFGGRPALLSASEFTREYRVTYFETKTLDREMSSDPDPLGAKVTFLTSGFDDSFKTMDCIHVCIMSVRTIAVSFFIVCLQNLRWDQRMGLVA